ncbi:DeoR/GlpR family DNA-binding transcription regulator [Streptomyces sp. SL13]|uniref:DeoR/GlpR family DNA-binding transcription regulator n=1 Tax=Streptantibioticus silvisoli TaxID=2705255 RepID=A0AA90H5J3_9ACTN|nr:DeoR/GlpR family DNA-binding transcription regulator [Streptantibioticus silvisoli]MDI5969215.1 DeoR/GlpR family DNA-binding transcription regulator [Streptantibioticus silvisoli]
MTATDRHARSVESLRAAGEATVRELAATLRVGESTVRRDLEQLDRDGELVRSHGGAALSPRRRRGGEEPEEPFGVSARHDRAHHAAMATRAAELVPDTSVVPLGTGAGTALIARRPRGRPVTVITGTGTGTGTARLAHRPHGRPVTVITGNVAVFDEPRDDRAVRLVLPDGVPRRSYLSPVGSLTGAALRQVGADIASLNRTGVRPDGQVLDDMEAEAPHEQAVPGVADRRVLVAAGNTFPGTGSLRLCAPADIDTLITTSNADPSTVGAYRQAGGKVTTV